MAHLPPGAYSSLSGLSRGLYDPVRPLDLYSRGPVPSYADRYALPPSALGASPYYGSLYDRPLLGADRYASLAGRAGYPDPGRSGYPEAGRSGYPEAGRSGYPDAGRSAYLDAPAPSPVSGRAPLAAGPSAPATPAGSGVDPALLRSAASGLSGLPPSNLAPIPASAGGAPASLPTYSPAQQSYASLASSHALQTQPPQSLSVRPESPRSMASRGSVALGRSVAVDSAFRNHHTFRNQSPVISSQSPRFPEPSSYTRPAGLYTGGAEFGRTPGPGAYVGSFDPLASAFLKQPTSSPPKTRRRSA